MAMEISQNLTQMLRRTLTAPAPAAAAAAALTTRALLPHLQLLQLAMLSEAQQMLPGLSHVAVASSGIMTSSRTSQLSAGVSVM